MDTSNPYLDLSTYPEIYQELVHQRNEAIYWLTQNGQLERKRVVQLDDKEELLRHRLAEGRGRLFNIGVNQILDRLYSHDAIEAMYDFNNIELGTWSETSANRFERQLQALQRIISKLEVRYQLHYRLLVDYIASERTLYLNGIPISTFGGETLRHRILCALYSDPDKVWTTESIEDYFIEHFNYTTGSLKDSQVRKAADDINREVAAKSAIKEMLNVASSSVGLNLHYLK